MSERSRYNIANKRDDVSPHAHPKTANNSQLGVLLNNFVTVNTINYELLRIPWCFLECPIYHGQNDK